jgi:hypothetical protein
MSLAPHTPQTPGVPAWMTGDEPTHSGGSFASVEPPPGSAAAPSIYDRPFDTGYARTPYRPTAEQLARDELRLAYWRRNVRLPIVIATVLVALLFVGLFALAFAGPWLGFDTAAARSLIAGLSGLTIIFIALPLTVLMALLPLTYAAWWFNRRHNRKLYPRERADGLSQPRANAAVATGQPAGQGPARHAAGRGARHPAAHRPARPRRHLARLRPRPAPQLRPGLRIGWVRRTSRQDRQDRQGRQEEIFLAFLASLAILA